MNDEDLGKSDRDRAVEDLYKWWANVSNSDAIGVVPKAIEYSSADLTIMGEALLALSGKFEGADVAERHRIGQEMAITFYELGKIARQVGAYIEGRLPSDDTIGDLRVYSMMMTRVRETGGWGL